VTLNVTYVFCVVVCLQAAVFFCSNAASGLLFYFAELVTRMEMCSLMQSFSVTDGCN